MTKLSSGPLPSPSLIESHSRQEAKFTKAQPRIRVHSWFKARLHQLASTCTRLHQLAEKKFAQKLHRFFDMLFGMLCASQVHVHQALAKLRVRIITIALNRQSFKLIQPLFWAERSKMPDTNTYKIVTDATMRWYAPVRTDYEPVRTNMNRSDFKDIPTNA